MLVRSTPWAAKSLSGTRIWLSTMCVRAVVVPVV